MTRDKLIALLWDPEVRDAVAEFIDDQLGRRALEDGRRERLLRAAVRWLRMTPDGCAATLTDAQLEADLAGFLEGEGAGRC